MKLNTASVTISFASKLEEDSARFYETMAKKYDKEEVPYASFASENRQNIVQIERAYYGVITDAMESCFAFNMNGEEYAFLNDLNEKISYTKALDGAIEMETKILKFYLDATQQSRVLMADLARVFTMIIKKRDRRKTKLEELRRLYFENKAKKRD